MAENTLLLLRHAQALAGHPLSNDIARPLSPEGNANAERLGRHLVRQKLVPERVLCSSAARARETWQGLSAALEEPPPVDFMESLYGASPQGLLQLIRATDPGVNQLLVIAHNPGIAALARGLAGPSSDRMEMEKMQYGYGPCDLAIFTQSGRPWRDITTGQSRLAQYLPAASLPAYSA